MHKSIFFFLTKKNRTLHVGFNIFGGYWTVDEMESLQFLHLNVLIGHME